MKIHERFDFETVKPMPPFIRELRDANRDGLKRMTRRVIVPQPISTTGFWKGLHWANEEHFRKGAVEHCKYGKPKQVVYMREPLYKGFGGVAFYQDDDVMVRNVLTGEPITWKWKRDVLSQLYMPRVAARSIFRYEFIHVERVQEISGRDSILEGVKPPPPRTWIHSASYRHAFCVLWDEINAKRGFGWDVNPWVWVLGYSAVG